MNIQCQQCEETFEGKPERKFCSRSCSTTHSNLISPKVKRLRMCATCENYAKSGRKYCEKCFGNRATDWSAVTLESLKGSGTSNFGSRYPYVRALARKWYFQSSPYACVLCGYTNHVEIAHIIDISRFEGSATISVVNSERNLIGLCPNHHWEFDNDLL